MPAAISFSKSIALTSCKISMPVTNNIIEETKTCQSKKSKGQKKPNYMEIQSEKIKLHGNTYFLAT